MVNGQDRIPRDDDELTDALREAVEEITGIALVADAGRRAWDLHQAGNDGTGGAA